MSCGAATTALGAYLVGALEPHERLELEAHLDHCPACRDELADLAPLPGLMSRLTVDEVLAGPPATDDAMLERLLSAASRERRGARQRRWLAAVAAAVVLVGGSAAGVATYRAVTGPDWHTVSASAGRIHLTVQMADASTGTSLALHLSGVPAEERCSLIAVSDTGQREVAGWWEATYSGTAVIKGTTSIRYGHLAKLLVVSSDGTQLVSATV
jgi:anti-sigma factor RsiW